MARTKETQRISTGGRAPRSQLQGCSTYSIKRSRTFDDNQTESDFDDEPSTKRQRTSSIVESNQNHNRNVEIVTISSGI